MTRYYDESKNTDGGSLPGVPLADIDDETFAAYPAWLQDSIDAHPMYRKTKPASVKADDASKPKAEKE